jgi:hypothetical protein
VTKTYPLDPSLARSGAGVSRILSASILVFAAWGLFAPRGPREADPRVIGAAGAAVCAALALWSSRSVRALRAADIAADEEGLWPAHADRRTHLIPWARISGVAERSYGQRLDLLGPANEVLLRVEYQLVGFEELRDRVLAKLALRPGVGRQVPSASFATPSWLRAVTSAFIAWLAMAGPYYFSGRPAYLLMWAVVVFLMVQEEVRSVRRVTVHERGVTVQYLLRTRLLEWSRIDDVQLGDTFRKGVRFPEVGLFVDHDPSPIRLQRPLGDAAVIYGAIIDAGTVAGAEFVQRPALATASG